MPKSFTGRSPFTGEGLRVRLDGGRIAGAEAVELAGGEDVPWLAPGLVDLQVNGYAGHDFNGEFDESSVLRVAEGMLAVGVTRFLPTLITAGEGKLLAALRTIAAARRLHPLLSEMIPCVHMEGPWISARDGERGAHPLVHVRPPSLAEFRGWQEASDGLVGLITLSPHWEETPEIVTELVSRGVLVSLGHTHATAEQIHAAAEAGAVLSTHLGNGIPPMLPRHLNAIWPQLADDRLTCMLLADGHHLPADALIAMVRSKGVQRSILTSDLVSLSGMEPGVYETAIGGRVHLRADGRLNVEGTKLLAGATATLADCVANFASLPGGTLADAITMASTNPAEVLWGAGASSKVGTIAFDWQQGETSLRVCGTWP